MTSLNRAEDKSSDTTLDHFVVMILPGNGCEDILDSNWYSDCKDKIEQLFENDISRKVTGMCSGVMNQRVMN